MQAEEREGVVLFAVKDSGPGISSEDAERTCSSAYWKARSNGTGLGLFIAQGIVRAHGGSLDVMSTPGRGATFFFTIPRVQRVVAERPERESASETEQQLLSG